ncbi:MAG: hypothetical protein IT584_00895, partial [Chlamydiae bacterium]|nr:hypothetical protein [Chlamydiota bacterium]
HDLSEEEKFEYYVDVTTSNDSPKSKEEEGLIWGQLDDPEDTGAGLGNWGWMPKKSNDKPEAMSKALIANAEEKEEDLGFQDMDFENSEKTDCEKQQQIFKQAAIAEWRSIGAQISSDPEKTLPLLLGSRLDVFLEAFCKNQNSDSNLPIVDYIAQASPNGQPNDIAAYEWKSSQKYLLFGLGIVGLTSRNPFDMLTHVVGGGSIEGHQTLVVIDRSNSEKPILWFYDPKGRDPNKNQKDAMAPVKTIPQRLEEIKESFEKKFGTNIQQKQLNVGKLHNLRANANQSIFNTNHCVYLCAGAAMDIFLGKESDFSRDPKKIVHKVNEEIKQAFPEAGPSE